MFLKSSQIIKESDREYPKHSYPRKPQQVEHHSCRLKDLSRVSSRCKRCDRLLDQIDRAVRQHENKNNVYLQ